MKPDVGPAPSQAIQGIEAYKVPRHPAPIRVRLDGNEGSTPPTHLLETLAQQPSSLLRTYPSRARLEQIIADRLGVSSECVLATNGGDDALDRACRAFLQPGRQIILPEPTFEMMYRYTQWAGGEIVRLPWGRGAFPTDAVLAAVTPDTAIVTVVSPNNPTGGAISAADLRRLSEAAPHTAIILDHAYVEFADEDLTTLALTLSNVLVFRTMSKAWGMAGIRVGYVAGPARWIAWLRAAGNPYTVSGPSVLLASERLETGDDDVEAFIAQVRHERSELEQLLGGLGLDPYPSEANFIFATTPRAEWIRDGLASLGLGIRVWPGHPRLSGALRITCPGDPETYDSLKSALQTACEPEALVFDMDGVLADVSQSYRAAIHGTCLHYGVSLPPGAIKEIKAEGQANNDWIVSQRLLARHGVEVDLEEVTATFERLYQGTSDVPGLKATERLLLSRDALLVLRERFRLGIVTGRPRRDAHEFLTLHGLTDLFDAVICMEDAPAKPDPAPVQLALQQLDVSHAWMLGDTVDDVRAATQAGVIAIGVAAPCDDYDDANLLLRSAGAARVLRETVDILELTP